MDRQYRKPKGLLGLYAGLIMNRAHRELREWGLKHLSVKPDATVLDVGCGGGDAICHFAKYWPDQFICGIDESKTMVMLSRIINIKYILKGRVKIIHSGVSSMPFEKERFDLVIATESSYFWPNLDQGLREIHRVLKPGGSVIVIDEVYEHEKFRERNTYLANLVGMNLQTPAEFHESFEQSGYIQIEIDCLPDKNWISVLAQKNSLA